MQIQRVQLMAFIHSCIRYLQSDPAARISRHWPTFRRYIKYHPLKKLERIVPSLELHRKGHTRRMAQEVRRCC